jgi:hypothetical protein
MVMARVRRDGFIENLPKRGIVRNRATGERGG